MYQSVLNRFASRSVWSIAFSPGWQMAVLLMMLLVGGWCMKSFSSSLLPFQHVEFEARITASEIRLELSGGWELSEALRSSDGLVTLIGSHQFAASPGEFEETTDGNKTAVLLRHELSGNGEGKFVTLEKMLATDNAQLTFGSSLIADKNRISIGTCGGVIGRVSAGTEFTHATFEHNSGKALSGSENTVLQGSSSKSLFFKNSASDEHGCKRTLASELEVAVNGPIELGRVRIKNIAFLSVTPDEKALRDISKSTVQSGSIRGARLSQEFFLAAGDQLHITQPKSMAIRALRFNPSNAHYEVLLKGYAKSIHVEEPIAGKHPNTDMVDLTPSILDFLLSSAYVGFLFAIIGTLLTLFVEARLKL